MTLPQIIFLQSRGVLHVKGEEAGAFLQGLVTNDVLSLQAAGQGMYACLLTPQGKFLHDFFIVRDQAEGFFIDCEGGLRAGDLHGRLKMFILRRAITITNLSDSCWVLSDVSHGGDVESPFSLSAVLVDPLEPLASFPDPRHPHMGRRWIIPRAAVGPALVSGPSDGDYDLHRWHLGIPEGSRDIAVQKAMPLEYNLDFLQGFHWTKGCYMGQELMARVKHRGLVRKRVLPIEGAQGGLAVGGVLKLGNQEAGTVTSVYGDGSKGFALVRLETFQAHCSTGSVFSMAEGQPITVRKPAWLSDEVMLPPA